MKSLRIEKNHWAVILGGSSGFGIATAQKLSELEMNICIVHRDRKGAMPQIEKEFEKIRSNGVELVTVNTDALSEAGMDSVIQLLGSRSDCKNKVRLLLHSIAYGNLKPLVSGDQNPTLEAEDWERTVYAMGTSLAVWTQRIHQEGLFSNPAQIIGLTSEGNTTAWKNYAAVSAAKCCLESISRSIAVEYSEYGIRSNIIQPGVTETPALKLIPGSERLIEKATKKNPYHRLTRPADVADVIALLCTPEASWINGAIIRVDGGEHVSGL